MTLLAFLLVSPVLVFGGGSPEPTATAQLSSTRGLRLDSASPPSQDGSVEVLILRSSRPWFSFYTSGCLDSETLTMKSCHVYADKSASDRFFGWLGLDKKWDRHNNRVKEPDCQQTCKSFHLVKRGSDPNAHCTLGVGEDYLSIGQDPGSPVAKLQKKPDPYIWQSGTYASAIDGSADDGFFLCNMGVQERSRRQDAQCVAYGGWISGHESGPGSFYTSLNVWLARYDNGEQIECIG